jgi:hypothetical protein
MPDNVQAAVDSLAANLKAGTGRHAPHARARPAGRSRTG